MYLGTHVYNLLTLYRFTVDLYYQRVVSGDSSSKPT